MRITITIIISLILSAASLSAQRMYIGGGHHTDQVVVSSSSQRDGSTDDKTLDGSGLDAQRMAASRFLFQAGFGADEGSINQLAQSNDYNQWIDDQMQLPPTLLRPAVDRINDATYDLYINRRDEDGNLPDPEDYYGPAFMHLSYAWWDNVMKAPDQLRYKVAHALSQILVISMRSDLSDFGDAVGDYFDIFLRNSYGNYKDILLEVTLHPTMGYYLSHLNNSKSIPEQNIHPDENYAREIMQLFTIGLYELNNDGSYKRDSRGELIPTYDNQDIKELAKVFTGLGGADLNDEIKEAYPNYEIEFGAGIYVIDRLQPMRMWEDFHESGSKTIVGDYTIPAGQSGMKDIEDAVTHLFNHPNVGPFVSRQLIQRMVTSNPSEGYIDRVASVFNNNGNGERGDMTAVVKAILLDEEARSCSAILEAEQGQMREPVLRYTHALKAIPTTSSTGNYWKNPQSTVILLKQAPMTSPTVFNFYRPDFQPPGEIADKGLVAPEFQLYDSETSIGYVNLVTTWTFDNLAMYDWEDETDEVFFDFENLESISDDPERLIHEIDILLTHGQMTNPTKEIIRQGLKNIGENDEQLRAKYAVYITLISPDYVILK